MNAHYMKSPGTTNELGKTQNEIAR